MSGSCDAEALFRRLWACREISVQEIADHYGVSRQAIHDRAKRRGLPPRGVRADAQIKDRARFAEMWAAGVQARDIAAAFGCSVGAVCNTVRIMGLPRRRRARGQGGYGGWGSVPARAWRESRLGAAMAAEADASGRAP